jgi:hypothetical protein
VTVTPERFRELTEFYGAEPQRWPVVECEEALAYMRDHAADAETVLTEALALDDMLSGYTIAPPSTELRELIVASAPKADRSNWATWLRWESAGLAGLGLVGALAGALVISAVMPLDRYGDDDDGYAVTAFDEFSFPSEQ